MIERRCRTSFGNDECPPRLSLLVKSIKSIMASSNMDDTELQIFQRKQARKRHKKATTPTPNGSALCITAPPRQNKTDESSAHPSKRLKNQVAFKTELQQQPINSCKPLDIISNDTLEYILFGGYFDQTPRQLAKILCVNKRFKLVTETSLTSLDLCELKMPLLKQIICRYSNLRDVNFSKNREFGDRQMPLLLPVRERLVCLNLRGTKVVDQSIIKFFDSSICNNLPLKLIDLSWTMITDRSASSIAYCCPDLEILKLSMCRGITDSFIERIPIFCSNIQILDVSMCSITVKGFHSLYHAIALREVDISACPHLNRQAINALLTGQSDEGGPDDVNMLRVHRKSDSFSQLMSISAQYAKEIDANLLDMIAIRAPHLRRLDLRHYQLSNTDLSPLKLSLRMLQQKGVQVAFSR